MVCFDSGKRCPLFLIGYVKTMSWLYMPGKGDISCWTIFHFGNPYISVFVYYFWIAFVYWFSVFIHCHRILAPWLCLTLQNRFLQTSAGELAITKSQNQPLCVVEFYLYFKEINFSYAEETSATVPHPRIQWQAFWRQCIKGEGGIGSSWQYTTVSSYLWVPYLVSLKHGFQIPPPEAYHLCGMRFLVPWVHMRL